LSQAELAARMGTSQSIIARLENGQTLPSTKTLLRYAEATGSGVACGYRRPDT
jgi:transcriptional regulator with XRE-family HTH domain